MLSVSRQNQVCVCVPVHMSVVLSNSLGSVMILCVQECFSDCCRCCRHRLFFYPSKVKKTPTNRDKHTGGRSRYIRLI